jgi:hypothetical protein
LLKHTLKSTILNLIQYISLAYPCGLSNTTLCYLCVPHRLETV